MEIKTAVIQDIEMIEQIYFQCSEDMKLQFNLNHWESPYPKDILSERIASNSVYKLVRGNDIIATFMLTSEYPNTFADYIGIDETPFLYLSRLAVIPDRQSKGIGSYCLSYAEQIAKEKGAQVIRLDVLSNHTLLLNFYIKNGYRRLGSGNTRRFKIEFFEKKI